jgi:DegV family protein with EDD domain
MDLKLQQAFVAGYERLASWADLLDQINVFPVADGDTGRNLKISLAPVRELDGNRDRAIGRLLRTATGNSGNIANLFFAEFLAADTPEGFLQAAENGRDAAWKAVVDPKPGTILTVFDALVRSLTDTYSPDRAESVSGVVTDLEQAVRSTTDMLPALKSAGVVDAGALAMFIYLEGFFLRLTDRLADLRPVTAVFPGRLRISPGYTGGIPDGYCVDTLIKMNDRDDAAIKKLAECGDSVVVSSEASMVKVHLHTDDRQAVRRTLQSMGQIVNWSDERLQQMAPVQGAGTGDPPVHIMTDAAGSLTRDNANTLGITLLDSYLVIGDKSLPETLFTPNDLYPAMRQGVKVSTSQASNFERHQYYASTLNRFDHVLYLCVGSVYTGNYHVATSWKEETRVGDCLTIVDTTAASGRLGVIVMAIARKAMEAATVASVVGAAHTAIANSREYVFLDRLKYLVAGGRLSKTSGFFGDLLHMKPIISPTAEGAKKMGVVRNQRDQVRFALARLAEDFDSQAAPCIMLEYSDNLEWVGGEVKEKILQQFPAADIMLQPLSLTSGAHMGPGTWGVAYIKGN